MEISFVGALIVLGLLMVGRLGKMGLLGILPISTLFSSTAVVSMGFLGGAPLLVQTVIAGIVIVYYGLDALRRIERGGSRVQIALIAAFLAYGILSAFLFPRMFEGATSVFSLSRSFDVFFAPIPLQPSSGNFSQLCYFVLDLCLLTVLSARIDEVSIGQLDRGFEYASRFLALIVLIELPMRYSGFGDPFFFLRTANYELLTDIEIGSFKRLTGFATESSSFGSQCAIFLAYAYIKYNSAPKSLMRLMTLVVLTIGLVAATSSAGYVTFGFMFGLAVLRSAYGSFRQRIQPSEVYFFVLVSLGVICVGLMYLAEYDFSALNSLLDTLIFNKANTSSGIERGSWNTQAIRNFVETYGFGIGVGSSRASSFFLALLSNTGVIGTALFCMLVLELFAHYHLSSNRLNAVRFSILVCVFSISLMGTVVDAGVLFYTLLGLGLAEVTRLRKEYARMRLRYQAAPPGEPLPRG